MVRFDKLRANIGEHFADYVLVVRSTRGGRLWAASDRTWAMGAVRRMETALCEAERVDERERLNPGGES